MIKKFALGLIIVPLLFSCNTGQSTETEGSKDLVTEVNLAELLEHADKYVDKPVLISGTVDHVCREGGKKLFIFDQDPEQRMKITVGKEIPSFDVELEGNNILFEGVFQELVVDEDYLARWEAELQSKHDTTGGGHAQTEHGEMADQGMHVGDMQQIENLRKQLMESGKDKISFYSIECIKFTKKEGVE